MSDYNRIEQAMAYLSAHASRQPSLEEVAAHVHLSAFHFQRMFCRWAGTTPKRFLQSLTLERGKRLLQDEFSLMDVSHRIGLSGSSRLHDHFVTLEAVTPGEFRKRGQGVTIEYGVHDTPLGGILVAVTPRGVCRMAFLDNDHEAEVVDGLRKDWPQAELARNEKASVHVIAELFSDQADQQRPLSVQVEGTNFQIAVWRALLNIPPGKLASYSQIARALGCPKASRAVGNAVGANPVALLIPCHRVIRQSGALGGYRWGSARKQMAQMWEQLRQEPAEL
ncbi:methylated-DNA--[protein]-cysteine S-methyltransferase [Marinobacter sp.]|jgi:AraC family transcriptional regulator of adaptative response/methylated-DNA-[protein]-cysteine methyltransferase|uniref:bifunctional transcriptional activator/DNA repair enzyme AdaA n=1 Tax=Marinobacter sp. TaxID=50741 RepID=UPI00199A84C9|nr:methylated-DNA--[protein]-cysteine S-methyltransferase [Marinobacter sp.]MBC7193816.1 methylated-DNA--[protein]-cysteine S-methyltransferase [Marinobacter sp.]